MESSSPQRDVFERTSAYFTALQCVGCSAEADQGTEIHANDLERLAFRRGYPDIPNRCEGRLIFGLSFDGTPHVK